MSIALSVTWLCTAIASAAPPTLTGLSPAGVQRGTNRALAVRGNLKTRPVSVWCDRGEVTLSLPDDKDELTVTVPADATPGLCWLRLHNAEGASDLYPLLIGLLPEMVEVEPNNKRSEATAVPSLPMTVDGCVHKSEEVDLFGVSLEAGQQLVAAIESHEPLGTPADMVLQIVSSEGYILAQNNDYAGLDPLLTFAADAAMHVYVRVFAFPATPDSSIRLAGGDDYLYRLTLTTGPFCSHVLPSSSFGERPIGWNLPSELSDLSAVPGLHWSRAQRRLIGTLEPPTNGPTTLPEATPPNWSQPLVGQIREPGEVDHFKWTAKKGEIVYFQVTAHEVGSLLDPVLQIIDAEGKLQKESDDISRENRDISVDWTPSADADYWVTIRDRFGHGGEDYVYRLAVTGKTPRVELTVAADHFVLGRKEPLEIPVKINRIAGYDQPLKITIDGLPEGVKCDAITSESQGDSSKEVKLRLEAGDAAAASGPIRIVAASGNEAVGEVTATAGTRVPDIRCDRLWLTLLAPGN